MSAAVVVAAGWWSVAQAPLVRAFTVWDVTDFGAVGDGTSTHKTINSQAIKDAVAAAAPGDEIFFPEGNYAVEGTFVFSKSLTFRGSTAGIGATIKNVNPPPTGNFIAITVDDFSFIDLIFRDATAQISAGYLQWASGTSGGWVQGCTFITPHARTMSFRNHTGGTVDNNIISPTFEGIRLNGACADMIITRNDVRNWKQRGIVAAGNASGAPSNLTVDDNQVRLLDPHGGGTSRYPIQIIPGASPTLPSQVQVSNNSLLGIDKAWRDPDNPGTADQLQLAATGFEVFGNTSILGGEVGMTITNGSDQGSVHDNTIRTAEVAGIAIVDMPTSDVDVFNNDCRNNGQNRLGDRPDVGRAGIVAVRSSGSGINITGNTLGDNQTPKTQCYGISLRCSSDVTVGTNTDVGNKLALLHQQCP